MKSKIVINIIVGMFLFFATSLLHAKTEPDFSDYDGYGFEPYSGVDGISLPWVFERFETVAEQSIDLGNFEELSDTSISEVIYSSELEWNIGQVIYQNGAVLNYSYVFNEWDEIVSVTIESDDYGTLVFSRIPPGEDIPSQPFVLPIGAPSPGGSGAPKATSAGSNPILYITFTSPVKITGDGGDDTGDQAAGEPVTFIVPAGSDISLDDIAANPIESNFFRQIQEAISMTSDSRKLAYDEYVKKTETSYYSKVSSELKARFSLLKSEIDLNENLLVGFEGSGLTEDKRRLIDAVVFQIRSAVEGSEVSENPVSEEFLAIEKKHRVGLQKDKSEYDNVIRERLESLDQIIDQIRDSSMTLYLYLKNDKIQVIINELPAIEEE